MCCNCPPHHPHAGISPDDTVPGLINIFQMNPDGTITNGTAAIRTTDREYVKDGTFHCDWATGGNCFFMTGVDANLVQDAVYGVNRFTGAVTFKHSLPAGIYSDNLVHDWNKVRRRWFLLTRRDPHHLLSTFTLPHHHHFYHRRPPNP